MSAFKNVFDCSFRAYLSAYERNRKAEIMALFAVITYDRNVLIYDDTYAFSSQCYDYECYSLHCRRSNA